MVEIVRREALHSGVEGIPLDDAGTRVAADGSRGQFVYVDRPRRAVVVKTSAWPYADPARDRWCRDLCYRVFPTIVEGSTR